MVRPQPASQVDLKDGNNNIVERIFVKHKIEIMYVK